MDRQNGELRNIEAILPECLKEPDGKPMSQINLLKTTKAYIWALSLAYQIGVSFDSRAFQVSLQMIKEARNSRWQIPLVDQFAFDHLFEKQECSFFYKLNTRMYNLRQVIIQSAVKHASQLLNVFNQEADCSASDYITTTDCMKEEPGSPFSSFHHLQNSYSQENCHNYFPSEMTSSSKHSRDLEWPYSHLVPICPTMEPNITLWPNQDQNWPPLSPLTSLTREERRSHVHPYAREIPLQSSPFLQMCTPSKGGNQTRTSPASLDWATSMRLQTCYNSRQTAPYELQDISNYVSIGRSRENISDTIHDHTNDKHTPNISSDFVELFNSATSQIVRETSEDENRCRSSCRFAPIPSNKTHTRASPQPIPSNKTHTRASPQFQFPPPGNTSTTPKLASTHNPLITTPASTHNPLNTTPVSTQNSLTNSSCIPYQKASWNITKQHNDKQTPCSTHRSPWLPHSNQDILPHRAVPRARSEPGTTPSGPITNASSTPQSPITHSPPSILINTPMSSFSRGHNSSLQDDSGIGSDLDTSNFKPAVGPYFQFL